MLWKKTRSDRNEQRNRLQLPLHYNTVFQMVESSMTCAGLRLHTLELSNPDITAFTNLSPPPPHVHHVLTLKTHQHIGKNFGNVATAFP